MNIFKVFLLVLVLLFLSGMVLAQEANETVALDEDIQPQDLGISEPRLLPDSPFYFFKNWAREIQSFFAFNPVKKTELRMKFANEKLMEVKKLVELKKNPEIIKKATENYQQEIEKIKERTEKIRERASENPRVESFLDKFIHQQTLHQKLLDRLETQVPAQVFEKIKEAREAHLERFKDVMLKLEDRQEKISEKLDETLERLKENPELKEKVEKALQTIRDKVMKKVKKEDFCGWSTYKQCLTDLECMESGCSGQVCQSQQEESIITTCEWKDCYDAEVYGLKCRCINNQCQWHK